MVGSALLRFRKAGRTIVNLRRAFTPAPNLGRVETVVDMAQEAAMRRVESVKQLRRAVSGTDLPITEEPQDGSNADGQGREQTPQRRRRRKGPGRSHVSRRNKKARRRKKGAGHVSTIDEEEEGERQKAFGRHTSTDRLVAAMERHRQWQRDHVDVTGPTMVAAMAPTATESMRRHRTTLLPGAGASERRGSTASVHSAGGRGSARNLQRGGSRRRSGGQ